MVVFFFLKDGDRMWDWLCGLFAPEQRDAVREIGARSWATLGGWLRGQGLVALFDATFIGLALVIVGTPLVLPLVVLTFLGAFIPIVGAFAAGAAAVLVALVFQGLTEALIVLAAIIVVQQVESNVFAPVIVGRVVGVHPVAILLAVTVGLTLGGIIGALVAPPRARGRLDRPRLPARACRQERAARRPVRARDGVRTPRGAAPGREALSRETPDAPRAERSRRQREE